jgi:hypothetical protein
MCVAPHGVLLVRFTSSELVTRGPPAACLHTSYACNISQCFLLQVCKLSAAELHAAAAAQLSTWVHQQPDLELPAGALDIQKVSIPGSWYVCSR